MRRSLVGFESPNFGHAFLDGFEDIERDEYSEDNTYFGDDRSPIRAPRLASNRGIDVGRGRTRALEGPHIHHSPMNGLRSLAHSKWQDKHSPEGMPNAHHMLGEPEPSLDDRLLSQPPPDWAVCCVCHEIFVKPTITLCGHRFCYDCILEVIHRKGSCPLCRSPIAQDDISEDKQVYQAMSGLIVRCKYGLRLVSPPSLPITSSFSSFSALGSSPPPLSSSSPPFVDNNLVTSTTASTVPTPTISPDSSTLSPFPSYASSSSSPSSSSSLSSAFTSSRVGSSSSPIAIRNSPSHPSTSHPLGAPPSAPHPSASLPSAPHPSASLPSASSSYSLAWSSLPSTLPSFMRTAAKWAPQASLCTATFALGQQATHEAECPFRPVACYNDGCNEIIKSKDLETHMESCPRRVVQCGDCKEMFLLVDVDSHSQSCPDKDVGCPHKCNVKVRRREQAEHPAICTNMEISCAHAQYGCTFRGLRGAYGTHQSSCLFKGLAGILAPLAQQVAQLSVDNKNQAHTIQELLQELRSTQAQVREQAVEIRMLRETASRPSLFGRDTLFE